MYSPQFTSLSLNTIPDEIFTDILENERYEQTRSVFNSIIKYLGFYEKYKTASYTSLRENGSKSLLKTVSSHMPVFLKTVFPDTSIKEDEKAQVEIINSSKEFRDAARLYVKKQMMPITNVNSLYAESIGFAYENALVAPTWRNVYYYAVEKKKRLPVQFLYKKAFIERAANSLKPDEEKELRRLVVFSDDIKISKYVELVPLFSVPFDRIDNLVQPQRMRFLVENNYLKFTPDNYKIVREDYGMSATFLKNNIDVFVKSPVDYSITSLDVTEALNKLTSKRAKCDFIKAIKNNVFVPSSELVSLIGDYVVNGDIKLNEVNTLVLTACIASAEENKRVSLGRRAIVTLRLNASDSLSIMQAMGGEFKRLLSHTSISYLTYSRETVALLNYLRSIKVINGYERKGDRLVVRK